MSVQLVTRKFTDNFILISDLAGESKQDFLLFADPFIYICMFKPNMQN